MENVSSGPQRVFPDEERRLSHVALAARDSAACLVSDPGVCWKSSERMKDVIEEKHIKFHL